MTWGEKTHTAYNSQAGEGTFASNELLKALGLFESSSESN